MRGRTEIEKTHGLLRDLARKPGHDEVKSDLRESSKLSRHVMSYGVLLVFSAADEISKLDKLKKSGSITEEEFKRLRARLVD